MSGGTTLPLWLRLTIGKSPKWTFVRIGVLVAAVVFMIKVVVIPIRVYGPSMEPTYRDQQINLINRLAYRKHGPQRGDVVGILLAGNKVLLMKRVIALPGERVSIVGGQVFINGKPLDEPWVRNRRASWHVPEVVLADDEYYCIGDNRSMHKDNHQFGTEHRSRIAGKVLF